MFKKLARNEFDQWARDTLPNPEWTAPARGRELVIRSVIRAPIEIHIYTTCEPGDGMTREKGADAIRCVLWDPITNTPIGSEAKVLRVEGQTTVFERLTQRVANLKDLADSVRFCKKCGAHTVERTNKKTGESFWGCAAYPRCGEESGRSYPLAAPTLVRQHTAFQPPRPETKPLTPPSRPAPEFGTPRWPRAMDDPRNEPSAQERRDAIAAAEMREIEREATTFQPVRPETEGMSGIPFRPTKAETSTTLAPLPTIPNQLAPVYDLVDDDDLVPTSEYPHIAYPFPMFNRVQSTILRKIPWDEDINLVLGTATSTGKTISAELIMGSVLAKKGKVVYLSPLKALSTEKFDDWTARFPEANIVMLTGDTLANQVERKRQMAAASKADIIIMTNELMDSVSRHAQAERYSWLTQVRLVIVDESHIITMAERGHTAEVCLIRFSRLVPEARILCLSATMPNVLEFQSWLSHLNGKRTAVINSPWRPTTLNWHFLTYPSRNYYEAEATKLQHVMDLLNQKTDEKFLVFVHAKATGRAILEECENQGITARFHNADLDSTERKEIEADFSQKKGGLRVLVSTSTLAWGSVLEGSAITLANGDEKPVERVRAGDLILSYNPTTGCLEQDTVLVNQPHVPCEAYEIELEDGTVLRVDRKHPFYISEATGLVLKQAHELQVGDDIPSLAELKKTSHE